MGTIWCTEFLFPTKGERNFASVMNLSNQVVFACVSSQNLVFVCDSYNFELLAFSDEGYHVLTYKLPNYLLPISLSSTPFSESIIFIAGSQHLCKLEGNERSRSTLLFFNFWTATLPRSKACGEPAEMSRISSVSGLCSVGHACFFTDVDRLRVFSPTPEHCKFFRIIRNGHEAYGMIDASLGSAYKEQRRAESYEKRMLQLKRRKSYFVKRQNEVSDRLPGRRSKGFGKLGTLASKTMANAGMSNGFKKKLRDLFTSLNLALDLLHSVKFTACTTLRFEGMFGIYNSKQIVPSVLELNIYHQELLLKVPSRLHYHT